MLYMTQRYRIYVYSWQKVFPEIKKFSKVQIDIQFLEKKFFWENENFLVKNELMVYQNEYLF